MDFNDTPEEARFRAEARAWLEKNAPTKEEIETIRNWIDAGARFRDVRRGCPPYRPG